MVIEAARTSRCGLRRKLVATAIALAAAPGAADAVVTNWRSAAGSGFWTTAANWTDGVPASQDDVGIAAPTTIGRTVTYNYFGNAITLHSLTLANTGGSGVNELSQAQGTLSIQVEDIVGGGIYDLSGGKNDVAGTLTVGPFASTRSATYELSGTGALTSSNAIIGRFGAGIFTQTGGSNTVGTSTIVRDLYLGYAAGASGSYNLSGNGTLTVHGRAYVGYDGTGSFTQSGGTATIIGNEYIGDGGAGSFNQSGGSHTAALLRVYGSDASAALSGTGSLTVTGAETILAGATFTQSGGTHTTGSTTVMTNASYALSSGSMTVGTEAIRDGGTFTQSGGTHVTDTTQVTGTGAYVHTGGTLTTPYLTNRGTLNYTGGTLDVTNLELAGSGLMTLSTGGAKTLKVATLSIADAARLQLNDNDLIVDYTGASVEGQIRQWVIDGLNTGGGITTLPGTGDTVLAIAEKTEWGQSTFNGIALDDTTVIGKYTYYGDANLDGRVTSDDYVAVDVGLGQGNSWVQGDFNFSGTVTSDDYVAIDVNLGKGTPTPLAFAELKAEMIALHTEMFGAQYVQMLARVEAEGFAALVPEPGGVAVLLAAGSMVRRRRR